MVMRAQANTIAIAPAPTPKARETKLLGNLFSDLEDAPTPKLKSEVKANLPVVKKLGNWDSESGNGTSQSIVLESRRNANIQQPRRRKNDRHWSSDHLQTSQRPSPLVGPWWTALKCSSVTTASER